MFKEKLQNTDIFTWKSAGKFEFKISININKVGALENNSLERNSLNECNKTNNAIIWGAWFLIKKQWLIFDKIIDFIWNKVFCKIFYDYFNIC